MLVHRYIRRKENRQIITHPSIRQDDISQQQQRKKITQSISSKEEESRVEKSRVEKSRVKQRRENPHSISEPELAQSIELHATRRPEPSKAKHNQTKGKKEKSGEEESLSKMLYIRLLMSFDDGAVLCTDRSASIDMRSPLKTRETCLSLAGCATMT